MPSRADGDLNGWWRVGLAVAGPVVRVLFRLRISGVEHLPRGAGIVAANHVSALDGVVLAVANGRAARRMTRFLVAAEFFDRRRFRWALRLYRQIPLRRGAGDAGALRTAVDAVAAGALAGIFPEGRVNPVPDRGPLPGHRGACRIALAAGAPVVPAGIWGTQRRWPLDGLRWRRPFRPVVAIAYGAPLRPAGRPDDIEDVYRCRDEVMTAIERHCRIARDIVETDRPQ